MFSDVVMGIRKNQWHETNERFRPQKPNFKTRVPDVMYLTLTIKIRTNLSILKRPTRYLFFLMQMFTFCKNHVTSRQETRHIVLVDIYRFRYRIRTYQNNPQCSRLLQSL